VGNLTLGDFLSRAALLDVDPEGDIDKTAAAIRLYNPGYQADADERDLVLLPTEGIQDLKPSSRETLARYAALNQSMLNKYGTTDQKVTVATGHRRGETLPETQDENAFASVASRDAVSNFDTLSGGTPANAKLGSFFGTENFKLSDIIVKTGPIDKTLQTPEGPFDGNDVLRVQHETDTGALIANNLTDAVDEVLDSTNRYSPNEDASPYIKDKTSTVENEAYSKGLWSVQTGKGDRSKIIQDGFGKFDPNAPGITVDQLRIMAFQTLINASGHKNLMDPDMIEIGFIADLAALIPSLPQIGLGTVRNRLCRIVGTDKVDMTNDDGNVFGTLGISQAADDILLVVDDSGILGITSDGGEIEGLSAPRNGMTYGTMNSFVEPFDGPMPMGMLLMTLYGVLVFGIISALMENAMAGATSSTENPLNMHDPESPKELTLGSSKRRGSEMGDLLMSLYGIHKPDSNYAKAVIRGIMAFYGIPFSPKDLGGPQVWQQIVDVAINLALAPGYYATVTKQVLRDFEQIVTASTDFANNMSVTGVMTSIFRLIESLFSSQTFRFINIMVQIGDIVYKSNFEYGEKAHAGAQIIQYSRENQNKLLNPRARMSSQTRFHLDGGWVGKYNLYTYGSLLLPNPINPDRFYTKGDLVIGTNSTESEADGVTKLSDKAVASKAPGLKFIRTDPEKPRISAEDVKIIEQAIDQEYMPFTIHDLRTNEIIALPAFVQSVTDNFSADYGESHGFGRTDPVMTYNKTARQISLEFRVAAMSKEDQKYMWFLVNKMVTMLYPQRSLGRMRTYEGDKKGFIQPFSQVPTASPLVRIRLGDLLASNYSSNGLSRLFGWPSFFSTNLKGDPRTQAIKDFTKEGSEQAASYKMQQAKVFSNAWAKGQTSGIVHLKPGTKFKCSPPDNPMSDPGNGPTFMIANSLPYVPVKVVGTVQESYNEASANPDHSGIDASDAAAKKTVATYYKVEIDFSKSPIKDVSYGAVAVGGKALRRHLGKSKPSLPVTAFVSITSARESGVQQDPKEFDKAWKELADKAGRATDSIEDFTAFMDPKKNAIVRSFESTAGRGLAGFITSLSLDYDQAQWEISPGQRGPMTALISMDFAPVHDLPLGLDYRGRMFGAAMPVGLAHTSPYDTLIPEAADDESQMPSTIQQAVLQTDAMDSYDDNEGGKEDTADKSTPMPPAPGMPGTGNPALIGAAIAGTVSLGSAAIKEVL
jgi:hypothetical protein